MNNNEEYRNGRYDEDNEGFALHAAKCMALCDLFFRWNRHWSYFTGYGVVVMFGLEIEINV